MTRPWLPEATDGPGEEKPGAGDVGDGESRSGVLRVVPDEELSQETINRVSSDQLGRRRLRALGR